MRCVTCVFYGNYSGSASPIPVVVALLTVPRMLCSFDVAVKALASFLIFQDAGSKWEPGVVRDIKGLFNFVLFL